MSLPMPEKVPEPGFYHHYKHDPKKGVNDHAYEVVGIGFHTEDNAREGEAHFLIYRPLYDQNVFHAQAKLKLPCFDARPLKMWMEDVVVDGKTVPRFKKITDPRVIKELVIVREGMY